MTVYVNDDGSNTSPYETLAKAATTFLTGVDQLVAGEDLLIGMDHSEALAGNTTYTFPGTAAALNRVISINTTTENYDKADNVQINASGAARDISFSGHVNFYGMSIIVGDELRTTGSPSVILFDDMEIELDSANGSWLFGSGNGQNAMYLKNTNLNFSGGGSGCGLSPIIGGVFNWRGGSVSITGTQPTALVDPSDRTGFLSFSGLDLSAITSALVDVSDAAQMFIDFHHCLINSGVALTTGTINDADTKVLMSGCDDTTGNDLYRLEYVDYYGSTVHDDAIYRDSGASDGTTNISWKMVSTANATEFSEPTKSPPIPGVWVDATGSTTFTISIAWDSAADLQDDEVWLELEFLEASADTDSAFVDDRMVDITATPADQTNNTETWTGTGGFGTLNRVEVAVTVTIGRVGPVIARVCLAKPSTTIYVDPKVEKS